MAVIYEKTVNDLCYQVRSAGHSRRLYTGGVFHSQYNPNHAATGSVWDLLFLPSQFYAPEEIKRVLVLGVGGGAVIHMLNRFVHPKLVVGVEINATHIEIAQRFFKLDYENLQWQHADAIHWMMEYDGEPFDLIIDDLYFEQDGEPQRAIEGDASWFDLLIEHLTPEGALVMNFVNYKEWRNCAYYQDDFVANEFQSVYQFATPTCHNAVVALLKKTTETKQLRLSLRRWPELDPQRKSCRLRYAVKKIA